MKRTPNDRLFSVLRGLKPADAQNRLMRIADREIAVSMMYANDRDREFLLSMIAPGKARRIREEFGFQRHLSVRYDQYLTAIRNVMSQIENAGTTPALRSYVRPRRGRRS